MDKKIISKFHVIAIVCILIFSFAISPKTLQNDTYYTIATGQSIIENGIDGQDHFAWTELAYTYPHWLYDVFIYKIYSIRWNGRNIYIYCNISTVIRSANVYY